MKNTPEQTRQMLGCGYLPLPTGPIAAFRRVASPPGYKGDEPTVCPGYTTSLPEVIEVARARFHWDKGALESFVDGKPTAALMHGIEILEGASNELQHWLMTPVADGGGRK